MNKTMKTLARGLLHGLGVLIALPVLLFWWAMMAIVLGVAALFDWAESP